MHFDYWLKTLSLEVLLLVYIRSLREGNFELYVQSLTQIMLWMFALDHTHYSRWLSVHIRDMMNLTDKHPDVLAELKSGKFVVHKTSNKVSAMSVDQCHEQNNAVVKGSGGAVGLTGNPEALRRWMVAGPEIARITTKFEEQAIRGHGGAHELDIFTMTRNWSTSSLYEGCQNTCSSVSRDGESLPREHSRSTGP